MLIAINAHSLIVGMSKLAPPPQSAPPQMPLPLANSVSAFPVVSVSAT